MTVPEVAPLAGAPRPCGKGKPCPEPSSKPPASPLSSAGTPPLHTRSPRGNTQWPATGTFVHRNHRRPNQLALSFPRLLRTEGHDLHVTDLDAVVGTPILDLAPFFPQMGPRGPVTTPAWPSEMLRHYWHTSETR
ncbi:MULTISPECIES: TrmO family methyltransferase domain-containing protein [Streptomyces]|uniref:TrmO family methyltransferase domain-containing protein n=1 Tax=Streptomyces TaxID=1883 RepID=UPI00163CD5C2|nr:MULTISPECIES: TrmO family methyltransferase [Streptomyces]MBC2875380.1 SAM-dependent methyltransferase [Streptomyces sp. TYQ1024]UBI35624.1 TrmO family methyltransferase [Streptomyces mobaraensis]UKW28219.1 TrmO family methyltransferase [Streptomyces sp. TYQ1024]